MLSEESQSSHTPETQPFSNGASNGLYDCPITILLPREPSHHMHVIFQRPACDSPTRSVIIVTKEDINSTTRDPEVGDNQHPCTFSLQAWSA